MYFTRLIEGLEASTLEVPRGRQRFSLALVQGQNGRSSQEVSETSQRTILLQSGLRPPWVLHHQTMDSLYTLQLLSPPSFMAMQFNIVM